MTATTLNAKRIGYLRMAPPVGSPGAVPPSPAAKSMWVKLCRDGLLVSSANTFARSEAGDHALAEHDKNLSEHCRIVLNAVKTGVSRVAVMKGLVTVINAGLVEFLDTAPYYVLTEAGKAAADPIGEEGYFRKSGNLVLVHDLCTDKGCEGNLEVERLEGDSKGKRMLIPRDAFVRKADWEKEFA